MDSNQRNQEANTHSYPNICQNQLQPKTNQKRERKKTHTIMSIDALLLGWQTGPATMESSVENPQKKKKPKNKSSI